LKLVTTICEHPDAEGPAGTLMLHLTGRCNLECAHCYMEGGPTRREQLRPEDVLSALAECRSLGVGQVYLTGGEPLLYPSLVEALRLAAHERLKITVCTNGTINTPRFVNALAEAGARVQVSVDGPAPFHDRFRRLEGAFVSTERGVQTFRAAGIPITVVVTVSRGNIDALAALTEWAQRLGVDELRVQPLLDLGRGSAIADERLTVEQLNRLLLQLSDLANTYGRRGLKCSLVGVTRNFLVAHPCGAYVCNGGGCHRRVAREIKKIVVREDGTILPEATNLSRSFAMGRLGDGRLSDIVTGFLDAGYERFDRLCRATYAEVVPSWPSVVVPWDQILAQRSHTWIDDGVACASRAACGSGCTTSDAGRPSANSGEYHLLT
jgi:MoaA/NifB/PqqE/SkfB family radical SAM enzyme